MFGIGPIELVILAGILLLFVGVPIALVVTLVVLPRKAGSAQHACRACHGKFAGSAKFCPHCGQAIA